MLLVDAYYVTIYVVRWNDYDVYMNGFLHLLRTNGQRTLFKHQ